jgi:copper transport protein
MAKFHRSRNSNFSQLSALRLVATRVNTTSWRIDGVRAPLSGRWHVRVDILISDFEKITIEDEFDLG